jgi:hypothetical protein
MIRWAGHVAYVEDLRNAFTILVTKPLNNVGVLDVDGGYY